MTKDSNKKLKRNLSFILLITISLIVLMMNIGGIVALAGIPITLASSLFSMYYILDHIRSFENRRERAILKIMDKYRDIPNDELPDLDVLRGKIDNNELSERSIKIQAILREHERRINNNIYIKSEAQINEELEKEENERKLEEKRIKEEKACKSLERLLSDNNGKKIIDKINSSEEIYYDNILNFGLLKECDRLYKFMKEIDTPIPKSWLFDRYSIQHNSIKRLLGFETSNIYQYLIKSEFIKEDGDFFEVIERMVAVNKDRIQLMENNIDLLGYDELVCIIRSENTKGIQKSKAYNKKYIPGGYQLYLMSDKARKINKKIISV